MSDAAPLLPEDDEPPLLIGQGDLLAALETARNAPSIEALRGAVAALHGRITAPTDALPDDQLDLPRSYLLEELDQIAAARTLERARYYLDRLARAITDTRTGPVNDLNLNRWKTYHDIRTDSLWMLERRDNTGVHNAGYWGNFVPEIPNQMMRRYTRAGDWVIDTFAGSGTTLIEAQRLGRNCLGVELNPAVAERTSALLDAEPNRNDVVRAVHTGDSASTDYAALLAAHGQREAHLVLMHPPYHDIIRFSDDPRDLSNAASVEQFLAMLSAVTERVVPVLARGRYLALVIADKYSRGELIPLGFLSMQLLQSHGLMLKSIVVKNFEETAGKRTQKELWKYRALVGGFYVFKHEYVFVFRKK